MKKKTIIIDLQGLALLGTVLATALPAQASLVIDGSQSVLEIRLRSDTVGATQSITHTNDRVLSQAINDEDFRGGAEAKASLLTGQLGVYAWREHLASHPPGVTLGEAHVTVSYFEFATFNTGAAGGSFSYTVNFDGFALTSRTADDANAWAYLGSGVRVYDVTGVAKPLEMFGGQLLSQAPRVACGGSLIEAHTTHSLMGTGPCDKHTHFEQSWGSPVSDSFSGSSAVQSGRTYLVEWFLAAGAMVTPGSEGDVLAVLNGMHTATFGVTGLTNAQVVAGTGPLLGKDVMPAVPEPGTLGLMGLGLGLLLRRARRR